MVISPPQSPTARQSKAFPLFNKLLEEGENDRRNSDRKPEIRCPATAPILPSVTKRRPCTKTSGVLMEAEGITKRSSQKHENEKDEIITPITLQDPPKSKLKRQLSVETRDSHDADRHLKKQNLGYTDGLRDYRDTVSIHGDEVDGTEPFTANSKISGIKHGVCESESNFIQKISPSKQFIGLEHRSTSSVSNYNTSSLACQEIPRHDIPAKSPNLFDLNDIGLTSPFASKTPQSPCKAKQVFVYPDSPSTRPRKLSPYRPQSDNDRQKAEHSFYERQWSGETIQPKSYTQSMNFASDLLQDELKRQTTMTAQQVDAGKGHDEKVATRSTYVTAKGFHWPLNVTITEAVPISPRVVTSDTRPKYPVSTTSSYNSPHFSTRQTSRSDTYEEDLARLRRLEREYERALEILGCPKEVRTQVIRSLSAVDKSPNEKSIRETREDVRNKYERTFSHPIAAPRLTHFMTNQLQRDSTRNIQPEPQQSTPWFSDARRRLFVRPDSLQEEDRRDSQREQGAEPTSTSTDIPDEVLQFLHSKNFHPEELENLKDFLRRGGSSPQCLSYEPSSSQTDTFTRPRFRYGVGSEYRRVFSNEEQLYPQRDRRRGDIDVRLSCESVIPRSTQDMMKELDHDNADCRCSKIEDAIRQMALQAYSQIRRVDTSPASFTQFQNEINETNIHVYESMQFLCAIKCLCKYGRTLEEVFSGSVVFRLNCPNIDSLIDLWNEYKSGALLKELHKCIVTKDFKEKFDCKEITLHVVIDEQDFIECKTELESVLRHHICKSATKSPGSPSFHARSRSEPASVTKQANQLLTPKQKVLSPFRERFCSDSSVDLSPRRAFQEINAKAKVPLTSPSKKQDNVFTNDVNVSSTRRQSGISTSPQGEQENVGQASHVVHSPRDTVFQPMPWLDQRERVTQL